MILKPALVYENVEIHLRNLAPGIGLTPEYVTGFFRRHEKALKTVFLQFWPVRPVPRREDYRRCERCAGGLHRAGDPEPVPHVAIHNILCDSRDFRPLKQGNFADDMTWSQFSSQYTARWGLCGVCLRIARVRTGDYRRGLLFPHPRPIDRAKDGRKRKEPDCEGENTAPLVMTKPAEGKAAEGTLHRVPEADWATAASAALRDMAPRLKPTKNLPVLEPWETLPPGFSSVIDNRELVEDHREGTLDVRAIAPSEVTVVWDIPVPMPPHDWRDRLTVTAPDGPIRPLTLGHDAIVEEVPTDVQWSYTDGFSPLLEHTLRVWLEPTGDPPTLHYAAGRLTLKQVYRVFLRVRIHD